MAGVKHTKGYGTEKSSGTTVLKIYGPNANCLNTSNFERCKTFL